MSTQTRNPAGSFAGGKATGGQFGGSTNDEADLDAFEAGYAKALADIEFENEKADAIAAAISSDAQYDHIDNAASRAVEFQGLWKALGADRHVGWDADRGVISFDGRIAVKDISTESMSKDSLALHQAIKDQDREIVFATDRDGNQRIGVELTDDERLVVAKALFPNSWFAREGHALKDISEWELINQLGPHALVMDKDGDIVSAGSVKPGNQYDSELDEDDLDVINRSVKLKDPMRALKLGVALHAAACHDFAEDVEYIGGDEWIADQKSFIEDEFAREA